MTGDIASINHFTTDQIAGMRRDCEVELRGVLSEHFPPSSVGQNAPSDEKAVAWLDAYRAQLAAITSAHWVGRLGLARDMYAPGLALLLTAEARQ